jgi:DNA-binding NtrC family response regulator/tetratricopeptide (TPR) repeat protein
LILLTPLLSSSLSSAQQAQAHALLAEAYLQLNRWQDADATLRPFVEGAARASLPTSLQQRLCLRLASLRTEQGTFAEAVNFARQALHLAQMQEDRQEEGAACHALGKIYRLLGQPAIAQEHYERALWLHRALGDGVRLAGSCFGLSVIAGERGDYTTAQQYLDRAFPWLTEAGDPLLYGHLCSTQASLLVLAENSHLAARLPWFARAYAAYEKIGQPKFVARTLNNWGNQLWLIGQWQEAQTLLERALTFGRAVADRPTVASALETLGEMHALQGNYSVSHGYLAEALAQVAGYDRFVEGQVLLALARLLQWQGNRDLARTKLEQVLQLATQTEAHAQGVSARLQRAELACESGEWALVEPLLTELRSEVERGKSLELIGRLRLLEGQMAGQQQNLASARARLEQAHSHFAVTERPFWLGRTQFALAQVYAQLGESGRALQAAQQARQHFQALAAPSFQRAVEQWLQAHPHKVKCQKPGAAVTPPTATASDALIRLLTAANARAVLARELVQLLQPQLPDSTIIAYEVTPAGEKQILATTRELLSFPTTRNFQRICLTPQRGPALYVWLAPVPTNLAALQPLLEVTTLKLELGHWRAQAPLLAEYEQRAARADLLLPNMVYQSPAMRALAHDVYKIQGSAATVLILGETGTGKELVARALHTLSDRHERPFLAFNCATAPQDLLEAHLFGHERGAFTGATHAAPGLIRTAEGGTLFLDEIAELPLDLQPKLLRFLEEGEVHPVGAARPQKVNVRVIAATNGALDQRVQEGRFRQDLYFRLDVIPLHVPPLRERREEIPLLARHFLTRFSTAEKKGNLQLALEALDALALFGWPGNVRQLKHEIQRLVALASRDEVLPRERLSPEVQAPLNPSHNGTNGHGATTLAAQMEAFERSLLEQCLTRQAHNTRQVAAELGLKRRTLYAKLRHHGLALPTEATSA